MTYDVLIIEYDTEEVVKRISCPTERRAEKTDEGVNLNLDHDRFYTVIEEVG